MSLLRVRFYCNLMQLLTSAPSYYVCEKSDGQRYLLYCTTDPATQGESIFLIDRRNDYWLVQGNPHFPLKEDPTFQRFHTNTLIDGELVLDREKDGSLRAKFLVFDCLVIDKKPLIARTLDKRLAYFQDYFYGPYKNLLRAFPEEVPYMPFIVEMKQMQFGYATEMMFKDVLPKLPHGNDGLIFTCRGSAYQYGTDPHILKWKPENENSIDFKLTLEFPIVKLDEQDRAEGVSEPWADYDAIPICNLDVGGDNDSDEWFGTMHLEPEEWEALKKRGEPLDQRIVECYMDEQKRWRFMKFRDDKDKGNYHTVVKGVIESIRDRVTADELMANAKAIKDEWKKRQAADAAKSKAGAPPK